MKRFIIILFIWQSLGIVTLLLGSSQPKSHICACMKKKHSSKPCNCAHHKNRFGDMQLMDVNDCGNGVSYTSLDFIGFKYLSANESSLELFESSTFHSIYLLRIQESFSKPWKPPS